MHKMNRQTFIAQEIWLKCSQGSETLFGSGVNYLLGQVMGAGWHCGSRLGFAGEANPGQKQPLVTDESRRL
jgi:hypothetical protein